MPDRFAAMRARAARRRANLARDERRWTDAAADYRRWLAAYADDAAIWKQLGHMLAEADDHDAADAAYRTATELTPDDADLLLCHGHLAKRRGDDAGAIALYARSQGIDGNGEAAREIAILRARGVAVPETTVANPEATSTSAPVGHVDYVDREVAHGWVQPENDEDCVIFRADGKVVGRAWPDRGARRGKGVEFRTLLALDGAARIVATRKSDGRELAGSPFETSPPPPPRDAPPPAWSARIETVSAPRLPRDGEIALLITHSATGAVKPHVLPYVRALADQGIATLLIAVTDRPLNVPSALIEATAGVVIRENRGYDFAAWAHALHLFPQAWGASILYLLNDSVIANTRGDGLGDVIRRVRDSAADVVGLTESHEYRWHLQSYFIALKASALSHFNLHGFFDRVVIRHDKDAVIRAYELRLAEELENAGCRVDVLFPSHAALNPVLRVWRDMLAAGLPFVKLLLLRGAFPEVDTTGWREALAAADFDLALVDATLHASEEVVPRDRDDRLSARRIWPASADGTPLKVAFYGPWNYDNGLGAASRNTIGALRQTDVALNLHPIKRPFHVHRPIAPAADVRTFEGAADIAIVHLNPDSWHLLTDEQREEIGRARRRVGYWVWEMAHIPEAWWREFSSVDRIWAPSRYCARLFAAQDGPPVDVIPHAVPVVPSRVADRDATLRSIGIDPARRILLYSFDGSSYLVRKNPAALVRAFAAAGLAERGWTLLLKTKHLMDRKEDGEAFRDLAAAETGVVLVDRAMASADLAALVDAADLYASPHASEGFGLTIAEAMAAGKPVIATDFGGSADFLDTGTGYPVRAHPWRLDRDFGHYTKGGEWARIDEPALAATLKMAGDAIEAGDTRIGDAARERVRDRLSHAAIGRAIAHSLADVMVDRPSTRPVRSRRLNLRAGTPPIRGSGDPRIRVVVLNADGSVPDRVDLPGDGQAEWIVLVPALSRLSPLLVPVVLAAAQRRPDVDIFYADDVAGEVDEAVDQFRLKPEFDFTLLCAQDYIGAPLIVRVEALGTLGLERRRGTAALADLLFRAHAAGRSIARIADVLLAYPNRRIVARDEDYRTMLAVQPALAGYDVVSGRVPGSFATRRRYRAAGEPAVTLIVPTRRTPPAPGEKPYVERLLEGIAVADWPMERLTVLVGDDIAGEPDWARTAWPFTLRRIETAREPDKPFNYAAKMNGLWRAAESEQIVFLNDDVRPIDRGWLRALQTFALDPGVGGVGARLLFEDGSLQHAGLAPYASCIAHVWLHRRRERGSYQDWSIVQREWSMVTGAVFATRRSLMEELGGFDEAFTVEFNDTDLCLRMRALGLRIVCTPEAELVHVEKASRGEAPPAGETIARFLGRWSGWIANDPSWHPRLRHDLLQVMPDIDQRQWYF